MKGENENKPKEPKIFYYIICPKCKIKASIHRGYCVCGERLSFSNLEGIYETNTKPVMLEQRNVDLPYYSCEKCGANCTYCASFSVSNTNKEGWGGLDCKHKQDAIKCTCCQLMIKNRKKTGDFDQAMKETFAAIDKILENRYSKVA